MLMRHRVDPRYDRTLETGVTMLRGADPTIDGAESYEAKKQFEAAKLLRRRESEKRGLLARTRRMHAPCRRAPCMHRKQLPARRHSACGRANPPQAVDVRSIDASQLGNGMAALAVALTIRICVTRLALIGSALNRSEAHFVCLAWVPKATVQVRASRVQYIRRG